MHNSNKFLSFKNNSKSAPWSYISFSSKLHQKIHWSNVLFFSIKIRSNKCWNDVDFSLIEITSSKARWNDVNCLPIEITLNKVRKNDIDFSCPWTLRRGKYVTTTPIFCPMKLQWKTTSKWCGHLSIFSLWHIEIILLSNWCWFDKVCPLGYVIKVFVTHENNV